MMTKLQTIYEDYVSKLQEVHSKARIFDGIWGIGKDPRKDACHDEFYQAVADWVEEFLATQPEQPQLMEAAVFLLETPLNYKNQACYWYMFAAQGHIKAMIPLLSKENCRELAQRLEKGYKRQDQMPLQTEILKLLGKAGK